MLRLMHIGVVVNAADVDDAATWAMEAAYDWDFRGHDERIIEDGDEDEHLRESRAGMEGITEGGTQDSGPGAYSLIVTRIGFMNESGKEHDADYTIEVHSFSPFCKDEPSTDRGALMMVVLDEQRAIESVLPAPVEADARPRAPRI